MPGLSAVPVLSTVPGLRAALPAALLLLLLGSLPPAAQGQPPAPGAMQALNPSDRQASRAAWTALHYGNYRGASPGLLRALRHVLKASCKDVPGVGKKYYLQFTTDYYISGENAGRCLATVLYPKKSLPEVYIKCEHTQDQAQIQEEDKKFYQYLQHRTKPIIANDIPDSHGNIDQAYLSLWGLAIAGSSSIILEKSTENLGYVVAQIKAVKQWIRKDSAVEFEFMILLHETPTQMSENPQGFFLKLLPDEHSHKNKSYGCEGSRKMWPKATTYFYTTLYLHFVTIYMPLTNL